MYSWYGEVGFRGRVGAAVERSKMRKDPGIGGAAVGTVEGPHRSKLSRASLLTRDNHGFALG